MRPPKPSKKEPERSHVKEKNNNLNQTLFRQKVDASNQNAICTASMNVGRRTMRDLLQANKYHVPIFQRRYCWTSVQWNTILMDAQRALMQGAYHHSLGRLTCTNNNVSESNDDDSRHNERSCILDGQQRFTTITILLASIRDSIIQSGQEHHPLVQSINELLFINLNAMNTYNMKNLVNENNDDGTFNLSEGVELPFARLTPTFCDRLSYYVSILPPMEGENKKIMSILSSKLEENISWHRPLQAKQHFDQKLRKSCTQKLTNKLVSLANAIMNKFNMLYFPIYIDKGHEDGTEDLMVVYERLALRDATFCKPKRQQEYVSMSSSDMIRNLLLGSFSTKENALEFYKLYWLPLEQISYGQHDGYDRDDSMNILIQSFLERQGFYDEEEVMNDKAKISSGYIMGGKLYADFQIWLSDFMMEKRDKSSASAFDSDNLIRDVGIKLQHFIVVKKI